MRTHRFTGFSFLELLFSILVFSVGMLAYMNYQGRASAMLFDTESSAIATAIAIEAAELVNSLTEDDFRQIIESIPTVPTDWMDDADFKALSTLFTFRAGPFDEFGRPAEVGVTPAFVFNRRMRITTFNALTNNNFEENTPMEVLRVVEIYVGWPNRTDLSHGCLTPGDAACNEILVRTIKPIYYY